MDFDWEVIGKIFSYLVPIAVFIIINVFFRKQQEQRQRLTAVRGLLSEIGCNQKLVEAFLMRWQYKKFKTSSWKRSKDKMEYIDPSLRTTLAGAYEIAEEFNREIDSAKRQKSPSYLSGIRVERLKEPLAESRRGLEEWLELNKDRKKPPEEGNKAS